MSTKGRLSRIYIIVAVLFLGAVCAIYLSNIVIAMALISVGLILRWAFNPVPETYRRLSKSTLGKVINVLSVLGILGLVAIDLSSGFIEMETKWATRLLAFGVLLPLIIVGCVMLVKEEMKAAQLADQNKIETIRGQ